MHRLPLTVLAALCLTPAARADGPIQFNRDVRPILSDNCFLCHGPAQATRKAGLRLDTEEGLFAERDNGRAVVPGHPDKSDLFRRITSADRARKMPPASHGKQLTAAQIDTLRRWIEQGARWQPHWAFVAPQRPDLPAVRDRSWPRNAIDHFILARLEREKLSPAPEAPRETLLRRVTFDLTGLPPTLAEIDDFLADRAPDAYEKAVDRLLASPRYGERMVLEWLDAARYSDTNGYQTDGTRPMWPWRDWVVNALNDNMPFDQFTIEQLAGDLLPGATIAQKVATGFNRNHMLNGEGGRIAEESRVDYVFDRAETTATVWLGLTLTCARCHDHKYDPLPQKEYYRLFAYFNNVPETGGVDRRNSTAAPVLELPTAEQQARIAQHERRITEIDKRLKEEADRLHSDPAPWESALRIDRLPADLVAALRLPRGERTARQQKALADRYLEQSPARQKATSELAQERKALDALRRSVLITMVMEERPEPRVTKVLLRGAYDKPGETVTPGVPSCLPALPPGAPPNRLGLARWLVHPSNPLTARVAVNRAWQVFFGEGLVRTAEDFGAQAEPPSHPELLDWLAVEFRESGWDVKRLHRLIVTSATYRQSSKVTPAVLERDPENRLLSRGARGRLSAFALRDQALALSGLLVERRGGPPVRPYQPAGIWEEFSFNQIRYVQDKGESLYRRSLYTFWRRSVGPTNLFDVSPRQVCTVRLPRTNSPLHALVLMNDTTYVEAARVWAERLIRAGGATPQERLATAFRMATGRRPTGTEEAVLLNGFRRVLKQYEADRPAALKLAGSGERPRDAALDPVEVAAYTTMANTILNLDEAICKE